MSKMKVNNNQNRVYRFFLGRSYHLYSTKADKYFKRYSRPKYIGFCRYVGRRTVKWSNPKIKINLPFFETDDGDILKGNLDVVAYNNKLY